MPTDPESGCICDQVGLRKKFSIRCQFWSSTPLFIVFQHKLFFNLVKDLVKQFEGLRRSVKTEIEPGSAVIFDPAGLRKN